ncbi:MAG: FdtA/QdtA family cupin domain-containing protein [Patescibacteria group bacterium]
MEKAEKIQFKSFVDERGSLTAVELKDFVDWPVARIYYLTDVSKPRGGHAVRHERKIYICQKGTIKARLHDGSKWLDFELKGPTDAIIMREMCFREFYDFSPDAVLMAVSSVNYVPEDYIYDLDEFIKEVNS